MSIPAFSGCTNGSYCSNQAATKVGSNQTQIYHRTVTTLSGQGPAYTGSETKTYIIAKNDAGIDTWYLASTTKTDSKNKETITFNEQTRSDGSKIVGTDVRTSLNPGGNLYKNTKAQVQTTLETGGYRQGVIPIPGTSGSLEKINPSQQKQIGVIPQSTSTEQPNPEESQRALGEELEKSKTLSRFNFPQDLRYPADLQIDYQDVIQFNMLRYEPRNINTSANQGLGSFGERSNYTSRIIGKVFLPIPGGISDTNAVTWGGDEMTPLEKSLAEFANSFITEGASAAADTAGTQLGNVQKSSSDLRTGVAAIFTSQAVGKSNILSRTKGAVFNPNMELLFSGPTLRPFNFTFKLSARGTKDRDQIRQIIRFFKQGMAVQRTQSQLFLKAPHTFKIRYLHKNKDHSYLNLIKECALQSFTVNYTPEGNYMTFADGMMTSYEISMQFQELEPIFNDDYSKLPGKDTDTEIGY
jgi:hypothetical protein